MFDLHFEDLRQEMNHATAEEKIILEKKLNDIDVILILEDDDDDDEEEEEYVRIQFVDLQNKN